MTDTAPLVASVRIEATPPEVFQYLVDPALFVLWMGEWAELDAHAGGTFAVDLGDTRVRGHFVHVEPPHRVVFTWGVPGDDVLPEGSTTVEVALTPDGTGTIVELTHRDVPAVQVPGHRAGWTLHLDRLCVAVAPG